MFAPGAVPAAGYGVSGLGGAAKAALVAGALGLAGAGGFGAYAAGGGFGSAGPTAAATVVEQPLILAQAGLAIPAMTLTDLSPTGISAPFTPDQAAMTLQPGTVPTQLPGPGPATIAGNTPADMPAGPGTTPVTTPRAPADQTVETTDMEAVPEPASLWLMAMGLAMTAATSRAAARRMAIPNLNQLAE